MQTHVYILPTRAHISFRPTSMGACRYGSAVIMYFVSWKIRLEHDLSILSPRTECVFFSFLTACLSLFVFRSPSHSRSLDAHALPSPSSSTITTTCSISLFLNSLESHCVFVYIVLTHRFNDVARVCVRVCVCNVSRNFPVISILPEPFFLLSWPTHLLLFDYHVHYTCVLFYC